jgi:hypothetical protein
MVHFVFIWYNIYFRFWYLVPRKIWQPCFPNPSVHSLSITDRAISMKNLSVDPSQEFICCRLSPGVCFMKHFIPTYIFLEIKIYTAKNIMYRLLLELCGPNIFPIFSPIFLINKSSAKKDCLGSNTTSMSYTTTGGLVRL